ncbi:MAG: FtsX-like permease family protein [Buchnera aphidicola (Nurudea shiraii)]
MIYLSFLISQKLNSQCKKNSIISVVTMISKVGIFLGTCVLIISFSALNGFQFELNNRILSVLPHGEILSINQPFKDWIKIKNLLNLYTDVISVTSYVSTTAFIDHVNGIKGIQLRGLDFNDTFESKKLQKFININVLKKMKKNENQIILGENISKSLSIKKGDWINIIICNNYNPSVLKFKYVTFKVINIFKINKNIDNTLALVSISKLQKYLNMQSIISGLEIFIKNPFNGTEVFQKIQKNLPNNFIIKNWITEYNYIYSDLKLVKIIVYLTMTLIIIISCFSISSINFIEISKKINNIAILKTLGISNNLIIISLLIHGIKSILKTGCFSLLINIMLLLNFKYFIYYIEIFLGHKILSSTVYYIDFIPISISYLDVISIFFILFCIGFVTSYFPAYYVSKIKPAKILKNIKI